MKIYLVNAGNDALSSMANDRTFPALGVLSLATAVKTYRPNAEVAAIDGQIYPMEKILSGIKEMKPDVVGVSVLGTSYQNSLRLAEAAKNSGAVTVFGNDQAAVMAEKILRHREFVDYICTADAGEYPFIEFLDYLECKRNLEDVSRLAYRTPNGIRVNKGSELPNGRNLSILDSIPIPDRTLYSKQHWGTYLENYMARYARIHEGGTIEGVDVINRARGCSRVRDACVFCGIADLSMRFSSPDIFWKDVLTGAEQTGANIFYEAFDSMSSAPGWIRRLIAAKPPTAEGLRFFVYTQAIETNPQLIDLYKQLGVYRVNMGFESGDDTMVKRLKGPNDSIEQNKRAAIMYREAGIRIYGSLVLGGPGETHESVQRTIDFARWCVDNDVIAAIEAQPLFPEMNATAGRWLMNSNQAILDTERMGFTIRNKKLLHMMSGKYGGRDDNWFNDEIARDWTQIFCYVSYEDLLQASKEIREYAAKHGYAEGSAISKEL